MSDSQTGRAGAPSRHDQEERLVANLVNALQDRISEGDIKIGAWIRQERVAQEFGVSRTPVREALRQLEALGVVEIVANRGARVKLPSMRDIAEVFEVRGVLEGHAAFLAARNITQAQLDALHETEGMFQAAVQHVRDKGEDSGVVPRDMWYQANSLFHATVIAASCNHQLSLSIEALHHRMPRNLTWTALGADPRLLQENAEDHAGIAAAIERRDADRARTLTVEHARRAQELILLRSKDLAGG